MIKNKKIRMNVEKRDGKVLIVFIDGHNHTCGTIAVANDNKLPQDLHDPKDILDFFLLNGYQW